MKISRIGIEVGSPEISSSNGRTIWSIPIESAMMPKRLWYSVPSEFEYMLTDRADPAVIALLIPALLHNAPLRVRGSVSEDLAWQLAELQALYSATGLGAPAPIEVLDPVGPLPDAIGVAAGFSAGIDSFAVLAEHHYPPALPDRQRLTHLLYNNVGSHLAGGERLWRERFEQIRPVTDRIGLPFIDVNSNLHDLDYRGADFQATHTPRNASVAHLLARGLAKWLYASGPTYDHIGVSRGADSTHAVDPIALPLMSTSTIMLQASGTRLRKIEKVALIAHLEDAWNSLDVCTGEFEVAQCSNCEKCRRTLLSLELLDAIDHFGERFDLDHWGRTKKSYLASIITAHKDPVRLELRDYMREQGLDIPRGAYIESLPLYVKGAARIGVRFVRNLMAFPK